MNQFLAIISEGASVWEIMLISSVGIIMVIIALWLLSGAVALIKLLNPKANPVVEVKTEQKAVPPPEKAELSELSEELRAAVLTAVSLELMLYHEDEIFEPTFDYQPRVVSGWSMANYSKN